MLKILIWRLRFEIFYAWHKLRHGLRPDTKRVWYFGYGANLASSILERREIRVFEERSIFELKNYELTFSNPQFFFEGTGDANVQPKPGAVTFGKLYLISASDLRKMDYYEGVPTLKLYRRCKEVIDGMEVNFYVSSRPKAGLLPLGFYLRRIQKVYATMEGIPEAYLMRFENHKSVDHSTLPPNHYPDNSYGHWGCFSSLMLRFDKVYRSIKLHLITAPPVLKSLAQIVRRN